MEQSREKLKVIDIEFKRNNTNKQTLFFDVIEHKFEDQFLVIKHYKEYADKTVRGLQTYIPKENIVQFVVYEEKADYEKYLDDLMGVNKIPKSSSKDIIDCHIVWYNKGSGGISDRIIRYVESVAEGINLLKIELEDDNREAVYIPMSNVALIEYFESIDKYHKAYPPGTGCGY